MKWPAQALKQKQPTDDPTGTGLAVNQPADEVAGTGLAVNQLADDPTGTGLAVKQPADEVGQPLPCSGGWWRECGGAGHSEGGLGPT